MVKRIKVGARGSRLSRIQAEKVIRILENNGFKTEFIPIKTRGDIDRETPLYKIREKGIFVKSLERALLKGEIDIAVHSAKDIPTEIPEELVIAGYVERDEPSDVIVCKYKTLGELPQNARIGTGSKRREYFLRVKRPDFIFLPLRGNIETRIRKWERGEFDAIIIAKTALKRLSIDVPYIELPLNEFPPAPGQGAICVETLKNSPFYEIVRKINNERIEIEVELERKVLKKLGGGCALPFGCYARFRNSEIEVMAVYVKDNEIKKIFIKGKNKERVIQKVYEKLK